MWDSQEFLLFCSPRGIPILSIQGVSQIPGPEWSVLFPISTPFYSFSSSFSSYLYLLFYSLCGLLFGGEIFFYKSISSCLYWLKKIVNRLHVCHHGDSCPWKKGSWQLKETNTLLWPLLQINGRCILVPYASIVWSVDFVSGQGSNKRSITSHLVMDGDWHKIVSWMYRPWIALVYDCTSPCWARWWVVRLRSECYISLLWKKIFFLVLHLSHVESNKIGKHLLSHVISSSST